jgi:hypothetical protein
MMNVINVVAIRTPIASSNLSNLVLSYITYLSDKEGGKPAKAPVGDRSWVPPL